MIETFKGQPSHEFPSFQIFLFIYQRLETSSSSSRSSSHSLKTQNEFFNFYSLVGESQRQEPRDLFRFLKTTRPPSAQHLLGVSRTIFSGRSSDTVIAPNLTVQDAWRLFLITSQVRQSDMREDDKQNGEFCDRKAAEWPAWKNFYGLQLLLCVDTEGDLRSSVWKKQTAFNLNSHLHQFRY